MERNKNRKKSVKIAGHRNSHDVWPGMTVGSDRETQAIRSQHGEVRSGRKRKPEDGWAHGVEIRQVAGFGDGIGVHVRVQVDEQQLVGGMVPVKLGVGGTNPALIEQGLGRIVPIAGESKIVINKRGTQIRVIAGAVHANAGLQKRGGEEKDNEKKKTSRVLG